MFFGYRHLWTTLDVENNYVFKKLHVIFESSLATPATKFELGFFLLFLVISIAQLLLAPKVAQYHTKNLSSSSSPILDPNLSLGLFYLFFVTRGTELFLKPKVAQQPMRNLNSSLGPLWDPRFFFPLLQAFPSFGARWENFLFPCCRCLQSLVQDEKLEFKLEFKFGPKIELEFFLCFFYCNCYQAIVNAKNNSTVHDKPELEPWNQTQTWAWVFFWFLVFFANALEVLLMPKVVQQRMTNLSSNSSLKLYLNLNLICFWFLVFFSRSASKLVLVPIVTWWCMLNPNSRSNSKSNSSLNLSFIFASVLELLLVPIVAWLCMMNPSWSLGLKLDPNLNPSFFF